MDISKRYNKNYFNWYKKIGEFGAIFNKSKFSPFINKTDVVLDFGCGGGYLLNSIECGEKYGLDINEIARHEAQKKFKIYQNSEELPTDKFDVIISNQVLQHCENPRKELLNLYKSLKKNGKIIIYVTCAGPDLNYRSDDINFQLYSWSPMNLGNLLKSCNYELIKTKCIYHRWPPKYDLIYRIFGLSVFNLLSFCNGYINKNKMSLCMAIGKK
tara:strand:+ start:2570 stop:3211 length:642 start_codon:yes stop_codon:yes gene_type:complete